MKIKGLIALAAMALATTACTDAFWGKMDAYGESGRLTCYSGGIKRFDDFSTGRILSAENSDGYYFKSVTTGKLVEASGDCTVQYGVARPADFVATMEGLPVAPTTTPIDAPRTAPRPIPQTDDPLAEATS